MVIPLMLLLLLAGCQGKAEETAKTENPDYQVERLFDHEGCRAYRFKDGYDRIYYVHCVGGRTETNWDELHSTGKTTRREHRQVPTESP